MAHYMYFSIKHLLPLTVIIMSLVLSGCGNYTQGDFKYRCEFLGSCSSDLPGSFMLVSIDSKYPVLMVELYSGDGVGAIQSADYKSRVVRLGTNDKGIIAVLENGNIYVSPLNVNPYESMRGPMTLQQAQNFFKGNVPILKDVKGDRD